MEQFTLIIKFETEEKNKDRFLQELINLFHQLHKNEENFVKASIHQNEHNKNEILVYEVWKNISFEDFITIQLKKQYALEWEKLLVEMDIKREPKVYSTLANFNS
ncbi:antibiotic biosynthesis monooxygenase [Empedobacter sp. UBA7248]|uniref:antibiotic biosynthesis monooxygenase n=1 Tax=Empedobacter sp. UBA7248 TaxID=1946448 RepID=UPI0025BF5665|nr:antibiotic biosynthesis monooxygenase [Empedobacter sp. UBA7248]